MRILVLIGIMGLGACSASDTDLPKNHAQTHSDDSAVPPIPSKILPQIENTLEISGSDDVTLSDGLVIRGVIAETGEGTTETIWQLTAPDEKYEFWRDISELDLSRMQSTELGPGNYVIEAVARNYAGGLNFTLPTDKKTLYVRMYREVTPTSLELLGKAIAFKDFQVKWIGYGHPRDRIGIVRRGENFKPGIFTSRSVNVGEIVTLSAPNTAGEYDLVYVHDADGLIQIDERHPFTVYPQTSNSEHNTKSQ